MKNCDRKLLSVHFYYHLATFVIVLSIKPMFFLETNKCDFISAQHKITTTADSERQATSLYVPIPGFCYVDFGKYGIAVELNTLCV